MSLSEVPETLRMRALHYGQLAIESRMAGIAASEGHQQYLLGVSDGLKFAASAIEIAIKENEDGRVKV